MRSNCFFSWNRIAEGRKKYIGIGEDSAGLDEESSGLWDDCCPRHRSTIRHRPRDGEDESRGKSHANPAWISGGSWLMSGLRMKKWMKWDRIITETCLHHHIPDQTAALDRQTGFWGYRAQREERWTLCSRHRCLELKRGQSWWTVFALCWILSPCCLCLHSPRHNLRYAPHRSIPSVYKCLCTSSICMYVYSLITVCRAWRTYQLSFHYATLGCIMNKSSCTLTLITMKLMWVLFHHSVFCPCDANHRTFDSLGSARISKECTELTTDEWCHTNCS